MKNILYTNKKLIAFDVDGTLSLSRSTIDTEMAGLLKKLLEIKKVGIITGGAFTDIKRQVLDIIGENENRNKNLILLPTNGGCLWTFDSEWQEISSNNLSNQEKQKIIQAIKEVDQADPELKDNVNYGREIQDRGSQITYAALGENAPLNVKYTWDPDLKKRIKLQQILKEKLPEFEVKIGGKTSIDITPKGMDKAYAIKKIMDYLKLGKDEILFIGDAVYENGNDYPVFKFGIDTIRVTDQEETKKVINEILIS